MSDICSDLSLYILDTELSTPSLTTALLGPWDASYNKKGFKAKYVISKDKANATHIHLQSCQWKGCSKIRDSILKPSTDTKYPASMGWFRAKSLHNPEVDVFVKRDGKGNKIVYKNSLTKEVLGGKASKAPKSSK